MTRPTDAATVSRASAENDVESPAPEKCDCSPTSLPIAVARSAWYGLDTTLFGFGDAHEIKKGKAQAPIRVAVTGKSVGPPLLESLVVLGRDETLARLRAARERL